MKLYPFPSQRPRPRGSWDFSTEVIRWMGRNALRRMHDLDKRGEMTRDPGPLAEWILETTRRAAPDLTGSAESWAKVERQAESAARFAIEVYDPEHESYSRAAKGGSQSRRVSPHLDALRALDHLGPTAAGEVLGIGAEQVRRLRIQIRDLDIDAELDLLVPRR